MDNNTYTNYVVSQLQSLLTLGEQVEGAEHSQGVLYNAVSRIQAGSDAPLPRTHTGAPGFEGGDRPEQGETPRGLTEEQLEAVGAGELVSFDEILNGSGVPTVTEGETVTLQETDDETGEQVTVAVVGGVGVDGETGEFVEIPGTTESINETNNLLRNFEEEAGAEVVTDGLLRVTYSREDKAELTEQEVMDIINAPISASLRRFSQNLQLIGVADGNAENIKTAVFSPVDVTDSDLDIASIALGMVHYGGTVAFPNIGLVSAKAEVNSDWADQA